MNLLGRGVTNAEIRNFGVLLVRDHSDVDQKRGEEAAHTRAMIRLAHPRQGGLRRAKKLAQQLAIAAEERGFTLIELIVAITILLLLTSLALPLVRLKVKRAHEVELHRALRELRRAIDLYKDFSDRGMIEIKLDTFGYPPDLDTLVNGVALRGAKSNQKYKFLRRIPIDPMTGKADWGLRSIQDDPDSRSWSGGNVFDVYSQTQATAIDGTKYGDW